MERGINVYGEKVESWLRRMAPYIQIPEKRLCDGYGLFNFINEQYQNIFLADAQKEICILEKGLLPTVVYDLNISGSYLIYISLFLDSRHWAYSAQDYITNWFKQHYPEVNPWCNWDTPEYREDLRKRFEEKFREAELWIRSRA